MSTQTTRSVSNSDTAYALGLFASLSSADMDLSSRPLLSTETTGRFYYTSIS